MKCPYCESPKLSDTQMYACLTRFLDHRALQAPECLRKENLNLRLQNAGMSTEIAILTAKLNNVYGALDQGTLFLVPQFPDAQNVKYPISASDVYGVPNFLPNIDKIGGKWKKVIACYLDDLQEVGYSKPTGEQVCETEESKEGSMSNS